MKLSRSVMILKVQRTSCEDLSTYSPLVQERQQHNLDIETAQKVTKLQKNSTSPLKSFDLLICLR